MYALIEFIFENQRCIAIIKKTTYMCDFTCLNTNFIINTI